MSFIKLALHRLLAPKSALKSAERAIERNGYDDAKLSGIWKDGFFWGEHNGIQNTLDRVIPIGAAFTAAASLATGIIGYKMGQDHAPAVTQQAPVESKHISFKPPAPPASAP